MLQYFLPGILALGIITSYEDIKTGKIRNKWIIAALVYAFLVYAALIANLYFTTGLNYHYLIELVTNLIFSVLVGFGFWYFNLWTAGDGKLFISFSLLIPFTVYSTGYQEWIPSLTLLINIFVLAITIMFVLMLSRVELKHIQKSVLPLLKELLKIDRFIDSAIYLFAINWIVGILLSLIGLASNYILMMGLTIISYSFIEKRFKRNSFYVMIIIAAARIFLDKSVYSVAFLVDLILLIFGWRLFRSIICGTLANLGYHAFSKEININKLKPGMILSESIQRVQKVEEKQPDMKIIKKGKYFYIKMPKISSQEDKFIEEEPEGLTKDQIKKIKNTGFKRIRISHTVPFAPFIFLGVILTLLSKGNVLILVVNLFSGG